MPLHLAEMPMELHRSRQQRGQAEWAAGQHASTQGHVSPRQIAVAQPAFGQVTAPSRHPPTGTLHRRASAQPIRPRSHDCHQSEASTSTHPGKHGVMPTNPQGRGRSLARQALGHRLPMQHFQSGNTARPCPDIQKKVWRLRRHDPQAPLSVRRHLSEIRH